MRMGFMTNASLPREHNRGGKTATIQIRVTDEEMLLLNAASKHLGVSKSALLREHGLAAAMEALEEERTLAWSDAAYEALEHYLRGQARPSAEMVSLMSRRPIWERD